MVDTIVFTYHEISSNPSLLFDLKNIVTINGNTKKLKEVDKEKDVELFDRHLKFRPIVHLHDLGAEYYLQSWARIQSNHKEIAFLLDYKNDCVKFNFSIPKFFYGNNIMLWQPHRGDSEFYDFSLDSLKVYYSKLHFHLRAAVGEFFKQSFRGVKIDFNRISVDRIDLVYNQVFQSKKDAIEYLNRLKQLRRKHARKEFNDVVNYDSSFTYTRSKMYNEKVYHKGTEYKSSKGDRRYHINENKKGKKYPVKILQDFADKILRYELTIHAGGLDYFYKKFEFRKKCAHWKYYRKIASRVQHSKPKNGMARPVNLSIEETPDIRDYGEISKGVRDRIEMSTIVYNRRIHFFFFDFDADPSYWKTFNGHEDEIQYEKKLGASFSLMCRKVFFRFLDRHKINDHFNLEEVLKKLQDVKDYKFPADHPYMREIYDIKHISAKSLKFTLELLKNYSLMELREQGFISTRQYFRMKKLLGNFGVDEFSKSERLVYHNFDFIDYNEFVSSNGLLFGVENIFK